MNEVKVVPESYRTSVVTPIKLSTTERTETSFAVRQVDNHRNLKKNLKGTLIIKKRTKDGPAFDEPEKFSRRNIKSNEMVEISWLLEMSVRSIPSNVRLLIRFVMN